jgi:hypothetical protein
MQSAVLVLCDYPNLSALDMTSLGALRTRRHLSIDARLCGSAEPVSVEGEDESADCVASLEGVEVLALVEVPLCSVRGRRGGRR